ncbi:transporter, small conductance mechanosensitive ion channel (MscS) family [Hyphomonas neptunium ATCC 15444]|uniref:Small-conductance mechanosensitive channel n=2 Tax=Hyphomonas TaxID=85 RepID=Q0C4L6_HYPNA|nr:MULTISPECIES: mechanosensitive ion channel domain-containing protein [Hyphomonas]ABI77432.1 transporter, small conductance mechanosensitive ion channel (MscS) family [Hyphomonas neptunium ATCC 15444]KCZ96462.1 small conductance mechanosensitive ion channel (MscS) family protein [Hyphomonas hirschiana VP5]
MSIPSETSRLLALLNIDTSTWPAWAATAWPHVVQWSLVLASVLLIWLLATGVKHIIRFIGKLATPKDKDFDGSAWDLTASVARVFALILFSPLPLGLAGYDWETLVDSRGPGALAAVAILFFALMGANMIARSLRKFGEKAHAHAGADDTLIAFSASLIKYVIFAIAIVTALIQLGFPAASLAAVLGAAGLAIGLALQDTLKAVAAGVMLAIFRPFRIGDYVTLADLEGEVTNITPFTTTMKQIDNKIVSLTNDKVWGSPLINHTIQPYRRLDMLYGISYGDDIDKALEVLNHAAESHPKIISYMPIWAGVQSLDDWAVTLRLRAWVPTLDMIQVRADLIKSIKQNFDSSGITIPFPTTTEYRMEKPEKAGAEAPKDLPPPPSRDTSG